MDPIFEAYNESINEAKDVSKKQYPDTPKGATQAFKDLAMMDNELDPKIYNAEYKGQKPIIDPKIEGVWMFKSKKNSSEVVVLYLKGYEDPYGKLRKENEIIPGGM
jgi:hypothetical protein